MSTYLVAYANGVFEYRERIYESPLSKKTLPLRVYGMHTLFESAGPMILIESRVATPDFVPLTQFALDVKALTLPHYENSFGIEYPLPKLDTLVASDFDLGKLSSPLPAPLRSDARHCRRYGELGNSLGVFGSILRLTFSRD